MQLQLLTWQLTIERVKPTPDELIRKYNTIAHQWQQKIQRFGYDRAYAGLLAQIEKPLCDHFAQSSNPTVLDCGIGSGALSAALAQANVGRLALHGVDASPAMASAARKHLARQGIPIQIQCHDVRSLPYDDNAFSMVMAAHTIEHLPQPELAIQEMVRVLQPGSPLLIVTTRPGLLGSLIDAQWGLTCLAESALVEAFRDAGLNEVQPVPLGGPIWCRFMSYALIGWKRNSG